MSLETIGIKQISDDHIGSSNLLSRDGVVFNLPDPLRDTHYTLRRTVAKSTLKKIRTTTKSTYGIDDAKLF
jgi:hypothetical protein